MKNLFVKNLNLNHKDIKAKRAERVGKQAALAQDTLVRDLQEEVLDLEGNLEDLEDLSPDNAMSLNAVKGDFKAKEWVEQMQSVQVRLANKKLELEIATKTQEKYFTEKK